MAKFKLPSKSILINLVLASLLLVTLVKILNLEARVANLKKYIAPGREQKYEVLRKLSVEVQISYFKKLLGDPTYINFPEDETLKEYIFVDDDYFAQAITDSRDKVLSYSITSRSKDFNPTFEMPNLFSVSLNKTPFSEWLIDKHILWCYRFLGAHDPVYYFEKTYFGNPGLYLTYLVGINNSALFDDLPGINEADPSIELWGGFDCESVSQNDRERITPNTFIVRGILFDVKDEELKDGPGVWFGPNNIQLRTLNE